MNKRVFKAVVILGQSKEYNEQELYELFDLLMGYSTTGERIDTWNAICKDLEFQSIVLK